ncbi:MAG: hypothetical protein LUB56_01670 [Coprobacillus sp.]|nr:hypothetical protein [Coprobacillus sp.]
MKEALKNKRVYIGAAILSVIGLGVPALLIGLSYIQSIDFSAAVYPYVLGIFAVGYFFVGFIWGDAKSAKYRKDQKNWDGELPEEEKTILWNRRLPWFFSAAVVLIAFIVVDICYAFMGHFPFV